MMNNLRVVRLAAFFCTSLGLLSAQSLNPAATVPRTVRYTGSFRPTGGLPLQTAEGVTIAVYRDQTGGDPLWQETQNVQVDASGNFAVEMGATLNEGLPLDLLSKGEPRWVGVRINRPGEIEQSRVQMLSVPYALRASDSETLGGLPASSYLLNPSAPVPGATAATSGPVSANAVKPRASAGNPNYIGVFTNSTDLTNSVLYQNAGKIGLNTLSPQDYFHVTFNDPTGNFTGYAVQNLASGATAYSGMLFYDQNGALTQFQGFNNSTHEYRINNIASNASINFMLGAVSKFQVRSDGDINIAGNIRKSGTLFLHNLGTENTAVGVSALAANTGSKNTAIGTSALQNNIDGTMNTAVGDGALMSSTSGSFNTAIGATALFSNTLGFGNTAVGDAALNSNTTGVGNTALGNGALFVNNGMQNTAIGQGSLQSNTTGQGNTALGISSGTNLTSGSNNLMLGNQGNSADDHIIRIGDVQTKAFIAGIRGATTGSSDAVNVVIDSNGQLGTVNSSRRFKEDIQDMGDVSSNLLRLRPVTYRYKQPYADGSKPLDYGLIAEEVADIYPDLVVKSHDGQVETVQYQKLTPLLLNEVQKQAETIRLLQKQNSDLESRLEALESARVSER